MSSTPRGRFTGPKKSPEDRLKKRLGRITISKGGKVMELLPGTPEHTAYVEKEIKRRKREAEPLQPQLTAPAASNPEMAPDGHTGPYWDALRKLPRFKIGISSMKAFILPGYPPPKPTNPPDMKLRLQNIASIELSRIQPSQVQPFARLNEVAEAWGLDKVEVNRMARVRNPQSLQLPLTLSPR